MALQSMKLVSLLCNVLWSLPPLCLLFELFCSKSELVCVCLDFGKRLQTFAQHQTTLKIVITFESIPTSIPTSMEQLSFRKAPHKCCKKFVNIFLRRTKNRKKLQFNCQKLGFQLFLFLRIKNCSIPLPLLSADFRFFATFFFD